MKLLERTHKKLSLISRGASLIALLEQIIANIFVCVYDLSMEWWLALYIPAVILFSIALTIVFVILLITKDNYRDRELDMLAKYMASMEEFKKDHQWRN